MPTCAAGSKCRRIYDCGTSGALLTLRSRRACRRGRSGARRRVRGARGRRRRRRRRWHFRRIGCRRRRRPRTLIARAARGDQAQGRGGDGECSRTHDKFSVKRSLILARHGVQCPFPESPFACGKKPTRPGREVDGRTAARAVYLLAAAKNFLIIGRLPTQTRFAPLAPARVRALQRAAEHSR